MSFYIKIRILDGRTWRDVACTCCGQTMRFKSFKKAQEYADEEKLPKPIRLMKKPSF